MMKISTQVTNDHKLHKITKFSIFKSIFKTLKTEPAVKQYNENIKTFCTRNNTFQLANIAVRKNYIVKYKFIRVDKNNGLL